jgi:trigger factor
VSSAITQALVDACTFKQDPPAAMVERIYQSFIEQLTYTAQMYGLDLKTLMTLYGSTEDTYEQDIRNEALAQTKQIIALQAVAEKENLLISDKDFEAELQEAVDRMNAGSSAGEASTEGDTAAAAAEPVYSSIEDVPQSESESYREYLDRQEAIRFLNEKTTITEPAAEEGATTQAPAQENAGAAATEAAAAQEKTEDSAETAK